MRLSSSVAAAAAALLVAGSAAAQTVTTFAAGFNDLRGVAVDAANNVLVNEVFTSQVLLIPAGGGPATLYANAAFPNEGVTVAASGDVYTSGGDIYRFTAPGVGGVLTTVTSNSLGMDFTSAGLLYAVIDGEVQTVSSGGVKTPVVTAGLLQPYGLAIGPADLILVSDQTLNQVFRVNGDGSLTLYADFNGVARTPVGIVFRGSELYVVVREGEVWRVSSMGATPTLFAALGPFGTSFDIAVQPDGMALYASRASGEVERISLPALPPLPATVPTLGEWAMVLMAALLALFGAAALGRRRASA